MRDYSETKGERREARRQEKRYGMRKSGVNMARTIHNAQVKRYKRSEQKRGGK